MGLDAVVYLHLDNFRGMPEMDEFKVDELTGEVYTDNKQTIERLGTAFSIAKEARLGNVSEIGFLRKELQSRFNERSILLGSVLSSGSHSGGVIEIDALECLSEELRQAELYSRNSSSPSLTEFILKLKELTEEAISQRNPIVFV